MSKNSSITNFFKPVPRVSASPRQSQSQSQSETPTQTQSTASTASSQPPSSPTPPPLLPHTSFSPSPAPPPPPSTVRDRNQEIRGSDDEDDNFSDSDDDLFPDLFAPAPAASTLPAQPPVTRKDPNLMGTPRAKRPAVEFHSSPLTINTRHKFDINALLKHAKVDDAIEVSQQRTAALLQGSPSTTRTAAPGAAQDPLVAETSLHDAMLNMLPDPGDSQDEATRSRLLRAVKRTEAGVGKKEWFFFDKQPEQQQQQTKGTENQHVPAAFPKSKATGVWFILADKHRSEAFEDGLAYNVQCRLQNLPDEIFEWVLREAPWEKSRQLRDEYVRLLGACSDQIERQLTQDTVMDLFRDLGASDRALGGPTPSSSSSGAEPEQQGALYPEQSRHRLETVLRILEATAHAANGEVLTQTVSILLRLGIDNLVREDQIIATAYQDALFRLISSVSPRAWNSFCGDVTTSLYTHTSSATLRWNAVSSIPLLSARLSELRQRMALVFVFDDPRRAYSPAAETFSIRSVIDRLEHADEFLVDRSVTDYAELFALCEMLSVAVGDGNPPDPDATSPEAIRQHNADVDELTRKVKQMVSNIHEQGAAYMSRMEVRVQLKDFERKLQHVVRTRPKPKEDIFGLVRGEDEEEVERPKQQAFMKRFLAKGKQAAT